METPVAIPDGLTIIQDTRQLYEKQLAVYLILVSILFETTGFLILDYNIVDNLNNSTTLHWTVDHATTASDIFDTINLASMLIFAIICDAKMNRGRIIIMGFLLLLIGFILYILIICKETSIFFEQYPTDRDVKSMIDENCAPWIVGTLVLIAIGDGAVRPNMVVFGADQLPQSVATFRYLDKFLVTVTLASIIETIGGILVENDEGYLIYFTTATLMIFIATLLFLLGLRYYIHDDPYDTVIVNCIPIYKNAFQTWRQYRNRNPTNVLYNPLDNEVEDSTGRDNRPLTFLDHAKTIHNGKYLERIVNDVKLLQSALILFIIILPYKLVSVQIYKTFPEQVSYMQPVIKKYENADIDVLFLIEFTTIIIGVFILNKFIYKYLRAQRRPLAIGAKFVISMCFAVIVMLIAGSTELVRRENCQSGNSSINISSTNVYSQVPQCVGMGICQVFGLLASLEFAYFIAPRSAKSLFMSLHFIARILSEDIVDYYMSALSNTIYKLDFSCNGKEWRTDSYFFIFAGVLLIFIGIFILCQRRFRLIRLQPEHMEEIDFRNNQ